MTPTGAFSPRFWSTLETVAVLTILARSSTAGGMRSETVVVDMLASGSTWPKVALMVLIAAGGFVAAALAQWTWSNLARHPVVNTSLPARPRS